MHCMILHALHVQRVQSKLPVRLWANHNNSVFLNCLAHLARTTGSHYEAHDINNMSSVHKPCRWMTIWIYMGLYIHEIIGGYIYSGLSMIIIIHYMISMGMSWAGHLWRWSRGTARPTRARELAASCGARQVSDLKFDYRDLESMACVIRWLSCFSVECDVTFLYKPCVWFRRLLLGDRACLWKLRISEPRVREEY